MKHQKTFLRIGTFLLIIASLALIGTASEGKFAQKGATTGQVVVSGTWGKEPGQFGLDTEETSMGLGGPLSFTIDKKGNIYVADTYNYRVQKFDRNGNLVLCFGKEGYDKPNEFGMIGDIAVNKEENIYVLDDSACAIKIFDSHGKYLSSIDKTDIDPELKLIQSIRVDLEDYIDIWTSKGPGGTMYKLNKRKELINVYKRGLKDPYTISGNRGYSAKPNTKDPKAIDIEIYDIVSEIGKRVSKKGGLKGRLLKAHQFTQNRIASSASIFATDKFDNIYLDYGVDPELPIGIARISPKGKVLDLYKIKLEIYYYIEDTIRVAPNGDIYVLKANADRFWIERIPYHPH